jgi:hypothetical protein
MRTRRLIYTVAGSLGGAIVGYGLGLVGALGKSFNRFQEGWRTIWMNGRVLNQKIDQTTYVGLQATLCLQDDLA